MGRKSKSKIENKSAKTKKEKVPYEYEGLTTYYHLDDIPVLDRLCDLTGLDRSTLQACCVRLVCENGLLSELPKNVAKYGDIYDKLSGGRNKRPAYLSGMNKNKNSSNVLLANGGNAIVMSKIVSFLLSRDSRDRNLFYRYKTEKKGEVLTKINDIDVYYNNNLVSEKFDDIVKLLSADTSRIKVTLHLDEFSLDFGGRVIKKASNLTVSGLRFNLADRMGIPHTFDGFINVLDFIKKGNRDENYIICRGDTSNYCLSDFNFRKTDNFKKILKNVTDLYGNKYDKEIVLLLNFIKSIPK